MALPTDSVAPDAPTDTTAIDGNLGLGNDDQEIRKWITALSPNGATVYKTGWTELAYGTNYGRQSFGRIPGYRRKADEALLRGVLVKTGGNVAANDVLGTLPAGFRPTNVSYFLVRGTGTGIISLQINANGDIVVGAVNSAAITWVSLDGIRIDLD